MKKKTPKNSLRSCFPEIAKEYDDSGKNTIPSDFIAPKSNKEAYFKCPECGDVYSQIIENRTNGHRHRPCSNKAGADKRKKPRKGESVAERYPELLELFHPFKNPQVTLFDVRQSSKVILWWVCQRPFCNMEFEMDVANVVKTHRRGGQSCLYCNGKKPSPHHNLEVLYPELAEEYDVNYNIKHPSEVLPSSCEKVRWICRDCGEPWKATVYNRTGNGSKCPTCDLTRLSHWQLRAFNFLKQIFPNAQISVFPLKEEAATTKNEPRLEADIIPFEKVVIEMDGYEFHKDKYEKDKQKNQVFEKYGYRVLRIRAQGLQKISDWDIVVHPLTPPIEYMPDVLNVLAEWIGYPLNMPKDYFEPSPRELEIQARFERSIANVAPHLLREYHEDNSVSSEWLFAGSNKKIKWRCSNPDCGYVYEMPPSSRTSKKPQGCPACAGKVVLKHKSFGYLFPEKAAMLDDKKNGKLDPFKLLPKSGEKYHFKCHYGHKSYTSLQAKAKSIYGCKECYDEVRRSSLEWKENVGNSKIKAYRLKIKFEKSLEAVFPSIWDYEKNEAGDLPRYYLPMSSKTKWLICVRCGASTCVEIRTRVRANGVCSECHIKFRKNPKREIEVEESFLFQYPIIAANWDYEKNKETPDQVTPKSGKKRWFRCSKGHSFEREIKSFVRSKGYCPECKSNHG